MSDLQDVKADLARIAEAEGDVLCRAALREIEALEAKLERAKEALEWAEFHLDDVDVTSCTVSATIAELKGEAK